MSATNVTAALSMLRVASSYFDVYALAGPHNARARAALLSTLLGRKVPQSQAGVTAIERELFAIAKPEGSCLSVRREVFAAWAAIQVQP